MKKKNLFFTVIIALALVFCLSTTTCSNGESEPSDYDNIDLSLLDIKENTAITADESAADFVAKIKIGWNLGNTMDAWPNGETSWGNPATTKAMITALKDNGFNIIRIPVSWHQAAPKSSNYTINPTWMKRVEEIVGYAMDNNMYVILNTHHDEEIFKFMNADMTESKKAFKRIWEQIADTFKGYDYNLIFEGLNEPRTKGSQNEWSGGTAAERNNLNEMHQLFVDTVRTSGGNNVKRILMISTYAASVEQAAVDGLTLPTDTAANSGVNKFIVSTHSYSPWDFCGVPNGSKTWSTSDAASITSWINRVNTKFVSKGIPVIGGEFGAIDKNNENARAIWADFYVSKAREKGIKCVYWDDGGNFRLFNRNTRNFYFPRIHKALMKGAGLVKVE